MLAAILATQWGWSVDLVLALRTKATAAHAVLTHTLHSARPLVIAETSIELLTTTLEGTS